MVRQERPRVRQDPAAGGGPRGHQVLGQARVRRARGLPVRGWHRQHSSPESSSHRLPQQDAVAGYAAPQRAVAAEGRLPRAEDQEASTDDPDSAAGGVLPRRGLGQRLARLQVQDRHLRQLQRGQAGPQDARQEEGRQEWRYQLVIMSILVNKINYTY